MKLPPGQGEPSRRAPRGRGSAENPPNRFERLHYADDPELGREPDPTHVRTEYLRDPSRSILAWNESPDLGFAASLNPYRGCEHGCSYCLSPGTPVLHADMVWRPIGELRGGETLAGFDEYPEPGRTRKLRAATVEAICWSRRPTLRLVTKGAEVVTTRDHRWLQARDFRWSRTEQLAPGQLLRRLPMASPEPRNDDYRAGYLAGLTLGDGTFRYQPGWRSDKLGFPSAYWRVALVDQEPLERSLEFLRSFGVAAKIMPFDAGPSSRQLLSKLEIRSLARLAIVHKLVKVERSSRSYRRGFLAGFFDAEGHSSHVLRISQVDLGVLERVRRYASSLGFRFCLESRDPKASTLRLMGSLAERMRFFAVVEPATRRKVESVFGRTPATVPEPIETIEPAPAQDVVDIQTSTGTFYAAGLATHNCYARPYHEYLGFSAGLDFETRILAKESAPELLRATLGSRRWQPQVIALSGATDPYQPVEARLRITRRCLEVLLEFRNPVGVVTKNRLVTRDADLLAELARHGAASVTVSITTLDPELQRRMEPRASSPRLRLEAIEHLARAGIPVNVNVAPVIPGLTDHEMPAILTAAAEAGASSAAWLLLRLPHAVAPLFSAWLEQHYPERREKVLGRIRAVRGGHLNDARFRSRMRGEGFFAEQVAGLFDLARRKAGLARRGPELRTDAFLAPGGRQLGLFAD